MKNSRYLVGSMLTLLLLSACNKPTSSSPTSKPEPSSSEQTSSQKEEGPFVKEATEITIWTTFNDDYQTIINNAIDSLKQKEPNITVNNVKQSGSYDDLKKMVVDGFAVDNYPDVVAAYPDSVADFIDNAKALDISNQMNNANYGWTEEDFADIPEAYIEEGSNYSIPGIYSLPAAKSTEAMYYNEDVLIGLDLSKVDSTINGGQPLNAKYIESLTWEELFGKLCPAIISYNDAQSADKKIIKTDGDSDWAVAGYDSDANLFITLAEQYGYDYTAIDPVTGNGQILFDNAGLKGLMPMFNEAYKKHYFATQGTLNTYCNYRFTVDEMLFSIGSTGGVKYQFSSSNPHNIGVAPIPHAANGKAAVISQGPSLAFLDHSSDARALATWLFYKEFTSTQFTTAWSLATGYSPIRYSAMETEDFQEYADITSKTDKTVDRLLALNAVYAGNVANTLYSSPVFKGSSEARSQVGTLMTACVNASDLASTIDGLFATAVSNTRLKM